jgi:hypothetical protein
MPDNEDALEVCVGVVVVRRLLTTVGRVMTEAAGVVAEGLEVMGVVEVVVVPVVLVAEVADVAVVKVKPSLVAVPPGVVTLIVPVVPAPTTAVICAAEFT